MIRYLYIVSALLLGLTAYCSAANATMCEGALNALASCAEAENCDEDITLYLPGTSRSALIGLEKQAGYSADAFDRYCVNACAARSTNVDEDVFSREVCGTGQGAMQSTAAPPPPALPEKFQLRGQLSIGREGVPLARIIATFGQPKHERSTPYECGSAFTEGDVREYAYPDFTLETDGELAVVRTMKLIGRNAFVLSDKRSFEAVGKDQVLGMFPSLADKIEEPLRVSASADGNLEDAFDFHFNGSRKLIQVEYWIGC